MDLAPGPSYPLLSSMAGAGAFGPSGWLPGASANRPSFQMLDWELGSSPLETKSTEKGLPSKLQSEPKVIQMAWGGHLKTSGFYWMGVTLGHFWRGRELISFLLLFRAATFLGF